MLTTKEYLVLDSGRILHYVIKKKGVRKKQKDRSEQKSPSQFHHTNSLIASPFLPAWPIPFETQQVEEKKKKKVCRQWCEICIEALAPQHTSKGSITETAAGEANRGPRTFLPQRSGSDAYTSAYGRWGKGTRETFLSRPPRVSGLFLLLSACFKGARVWELLVIFLLPAIPGYQSRGFAVEYRADLKLISLSFLPSRYLFC